MIHKLSTRQNREPLDHYHFRCQYLPIYTFGESIKPNQPNIIEFCDVSICFILAVGDFRNSHYLIISLRSSKIASQTARKYILRVPQIVETISIKRTLCSLGKISRKVSSWNSMNPLKIPVVITSQKIVCQPVYCTISYLTTQLTAAKRPSKIPRRCFIIISLTVARMSKVMLTEVWRRNQDKQLELHKWSLSMCLRNRRLQKK